jgi:hypothetical protein
MGYNKRLFKKKKTHRCVLFEFTDDVAFEAAESLLYTPT